MKNKHFFRGAASSVQSTHLRRAWLYGGVGVGAVLLGAGAWVTLLPTLRPSGTSDMSPITSPIAKICMQPSEQKPLQDYYFKGAVSMYFKPTITYKERKQFIQDGNYTVNSGMEDEPIRVDVKMAPTFMARHAVAVRDVSDFLNKVRSDTDVQGVVASPIWQTTTTGNAPVSVADRWDAFTITLTDSAKRDAFLRRYPVATYLANGYTDRRVSDPAKLIVLYKADEMLATVRQIKTEANLPDTVPNTPRRSSFPPLETLFSVTEPSTAGASPEAMLSLYFPVDWDQTAIRQLLAKHSEVVSTVEIPDFQASWRDYVSIRVPENQERCWARELNKLPQIINATIDIAAKAD